MMLVNIFQVAMLGKKKNKTQQPFALTLFTSCFFKFLISKNTKSLTLHVAYYYNILITTI